MTRGPRHSMEPGGGGGEAGGVASQLQIPSLSTWGCPAEAMDTWPGESRGTQLSPSPTLGDIPEYPGALGLLAEEGNRAQALPRYLPPFRSHFRDQSPALQAGFQGHFLVATV